MSDSHAIERVTLARKDCTVGRKRYCIVSGTMFALIAMSHLIRLLLGSTVHIGDWLLPGWTSLIGLLVAGAFSVWAFREFAKRE